MNVKWGRQSFTAIEVNTDEEPLLFKAQLFALTGVQPERQKVMWRGSQLKDCEWNIQLKNVRCLLILRAIKNLLIREPLYYCLDPKKRFLKHQKRLHFL